MSLLCNHLRCESMEIKQLDESRRDAWNEYVQCHPDASPYHLFGWQAAIKDAYSYNSFSLLAFEGSNVVGVMPLVCLEIPLMGRTLVGLPYCDVGHALSDSEEVNRQLHDYALGMAGKLNFRAIEVRGSLCGDFFRDHPDDMVIQKGKVRMLLEMPSSSELLWDSLKSKLRSQVRKAEKNGLTFRWGAEGDLAYFYDVFSTNMRDLGSPVHSRKLFAAVFKHYGPGAKLGLVYKDEKPVAAGVMLQVGSQIAVPWASTLKEYNRLSPNMLLYWNFLKYAADSGIVRFDFGRSSEGEGTYSFKLQWGARPVSLDWWKMLVQGKTTAHPPSGAGLRKTAESIWRRLPLVLANVLGPHVRKYVSL